MPRKYPRTVRRQFGKRRAVMQAALYYMRKKNKARRAS